MYTTNIIPLDQLCSIHFDYFLKYLRQAYHINVTNNQWDIVADISIYGASAQISVREDRVSVYDVHLCKSLLLRYKFLDVLKSIISN